MIFVIAGAQNGRFCFQNKSKKNQLYLKKKKNSKMILELKLTVGTLITTIKANKSQRAVLQGLGSCGTRGHTGELGKVFL